MNARQAVSVPLSNGGTAIVDREDFVREIDYYHRSGAVIQVCPADYTWRRSTQDRWQYARTKVVRNHRIFTVYLHRLIIGAKPGEIVDHINGDRLDNRRSNLRTCTAAQNISNMAIRRRGRSKFKGVYYDKKAGRWKAQIGHNNKRFALGRFASELDAAIAYDAAACQLFLEFANPNFASTAAIESARKRLLSAA